MCQEICRVINLTLTFKINVSALIFSGGGSPVPQSSWNPSQKAHGLLITVNGDRDVGLNLEWSPRAGSPSAVDEDANKEKGY